MCGKNDDVLKPDENGNFHDIDLVVVGVDDENESTSVFIQRLQDEGEKVPVRTDSFNLPDWYDVDKYKKGQQYFYKNYYALFVTKLCGLIVVLSVPSILKVLVLTGKSDTPGKAFRRYMDTIEAMLDWYGGDLNNRDSNTRKAVITVKGKHCAASKKAVTNKMGFISQRDMALTQFGFIGISVLKAKQMGFVGTADELEGFIHLWRAIGYCMGIEDRFNICGGNVNQVTEICERLSRLVFKPYLEKPCEHFNEMSTVLLVGMKPVVPLLTPTAFMEVCKRCMNFEPKEVEGIYSKCMLAILLYINTVLLTVWWVAVIFRPILNGLLRFSIYCNLKFPLVAYLTMGKEVWRETETKNHHHQEAATH